MSNFSEIFTKIRLNHLDKIYNESRIYRSDINTFIEFENNCLAVEEQLNLLGYSLSNLYRDTEDFEDDIRCIQKFIECYLESNINLENLKILYKIYKHAFTEKNNSDLKIVICDDYLKYSGGYWNNVTHCFERLEDKFKPVYSSAYPVNGRGGSSKALFCADKTPDEIEGLIKKFKIHEQKINNYEAMEPLMFSELLETLDTYDDTCLSNTIRICKATIAGEECLVQMETPKY